MTRAKTVTLLFMRLMNDFRLWATAALLILSVSASAQKYHNGVVDKSIAVIGNEMIMISDLEEEIQMMRAIDLSTTPL